jgi:hypothetical protein
MDANTSSTIEPESMYNYMNGLLMDPTVFIILVFVVIIYIIVFVSLGDSSTSPTTTNSGLMNNSSGLEGSTNLIIMVVIGILIVLILFNALQYFFSIDIIASIKNLFTPQKQLDITINQSTAVPIDLSFNNTLFSDSIGQQVFNVPGNYYCYDQAQTLCKAYDSRLATYDEVENAYNKGGEWCNYGWSDGQMALFPTQKMTFDNLQKIKGHEHDCGRTGVNGGYIANPNVKFGVNCFGHKPKITSEEEEMMKNMSPYPQTEKDIVMEKQVDFWKTKIDDILLSPFNYNSWSRY